MSERRHGNEGGLTRPDPALARTSAEFIECLRLLKLWVGDPSFKELRRRCKVPASTLSDALNPKVARLPRLEVVRAFVSACGVTPADEARWVAAWRALRLGQSTAAATASAPPSVTIPRQSPRDLLQVIGRDDIIDRIDAIHREHLAGRHTSPLVLITGPSGTGTGTSAVALFWAQQRTHAFPDGHLYLDLRVTGGADHAGLPLLLRQLGVAGARHPPRPRHPGRASTGRSQLTGNS